MSGSNVNGYLLRTYGRNMSGSNVNGYLLRTYGRILIRRKDV